VTQIESQAAIFRRARNEIGFVKSRCVRGLGRVFVLLHYILPLGIGNECHDGCVARSLPIAPPLCRAGEYFCHAAHVLRGKLKNRPRIRVNLE